MELAHYVHVIRNWLWLIIIAAFIGGGISFILTTGQVPYYTAQATVSIGQYIQDPNPTANQIYVGQNLVATYQQLVQTRDVLQGVATTLKLTMTPEAIGSLISTDAIENTSLMVIKVRYTDPVLTADIANAVANQLIANSPTNLTAAQQQTVDFANAQIQALTAQVNQQRTESAQIDQQLATSTDPTDIDTLNKRKSTLVDQINQATATIAQFQTTISNLQQKTNAITLVDSAQIPQVAAAGSSRSLLIIGAAFGAALAIGLVFLLDYLDDRIRTAEVATQLLSLPVLGAVPRFGKKTAPSKEHLITNYETLSEVAETYRRLRTNLVYLNAQNSQKVFVLTSAGPNEGKSVTTANLAVTMASAGMRVLLIDADMRRPVQHEIFGLENSVGLSTLLFVDSNKVNKLSPGEAAEQIPQSLDRCIQSTEVPNLKVITSGFLPSNPAEILGSPLMNRWVDAFRASSDTDVILIDTPPVMLFSDSSILAALVSADVLLIIDGSKTHRNAALQSREQLQQVGADVKGVILNRLNPRDDVNYYGSYYTSYYYSQKKEPGRLGFLRWFGR